MGLFLDVLIAFERSGRMGEVFFGNFWIYLRIGLGCVCVGIKESVCRFLGGCIFLDVDVSLFY